MNKDIVGGHANKIYVSEKDPSILIKETSESELQLYEKVNNL